ncbi:MarR family winged helix-turn-helix transcriptional regulator, partial [Patulibacter sp. S7RM1-6]
MSGTPQSAPRPDDRPERLPEAIAHHEGLSVLKLAGWLQARLDDALGDGFKTRHYMTASVLEHVGSLTQHEVGRKLRIDKATMTAVVTDLERAGLLERHRDPEDRRHLRLAITADGRGWLAERERLVQRVEDEAFAPLDAARRDGLRAALTAVFAP